MRGFLKKVDFLDWAARIVPVRKGNGNIRVRGDYKVTIKSVIHRQEYHLPLPEELFAQLNGSQKFSKLDLSNAYLQIVLDPVSQKYVTINTNLGLFQFTRLPF